jgi:hypothetical protein
VERIQFLGYNQDLLEKAAGNRDPHFDILEVLVS